MRMSDWSSDVCSSDLRRARRLVSGLASDVGTPPVSRVAWRRDVRIIRSRFPPIDRFEDIADPADWPLLLSAEQKTNPRLMKTIGRRDLVPPARRVGGPGASYLLAPFTPASTDRPTRFSDGRFGVLYAGNRFEVALLETIYPPGPFPAPPPHPPARTPQFPALPT